MPDVGIDSQLDLQPIFERFRSSHSTASFLETMLKNLRARIFRNTRVKLEKYFVGLFMIMAVFGCYRSLAFLMSGSGVFFDCFIYLFKAVNSESFDCVAILEHSELSTTCEYVGPT